MAALIGLELEPNFTDAEILQAFEQAKKNMDLLIQHKKPTHISVTFAVSSYNSDRREVWEIVECKELFSRAIKLGWYGLALYPARFQISCDGSSFNDDMKQMIYWLPMAVVYGENGGINPGDPQHREIIRKSLDAFNTRFGSD